MTDDAFLQAIIEDPDDDGPRLVYADFLDERGDPQGEVIRLQCERATLAEDDPRVEALVKREQELLAEHQEEWVGAVGLFSTGYAFRRGFIESVTLPVEDFLRQATKCL